MVVNSIKRSKAKVTMNENVKKIVFYSAHIVKSGLIYQDQKRSMTHSTHIIEYISPAFCDSCL